MIVSIARQDVISAITVPNWMDPFANYAILPNFHALTPRLKPWFVRTIKAVHPTNSVNSFWILPQICMSKYVLLVQTIAQNVLTAIL